MPSLATSLCPATLVALGLLATPLAAADAAPDSNSDAVGRVLRDYVRAGDDPVITTLVAQLGDADYAVREAATHRLRAMPLMPAAALARADTDDLEVRCRIEVIRDAAEASTCRLVMAALRAIESERIAGLAEPVLKTIAAGDGDDDGLVEAGIRAAAATARPDDAALLSASIIAETWGVRAAAAAGLLAAQGLDAAETVRPLLADRDDRVRIHVARRLAALGDRMALDRLCDLLESGDVAVRSQAIEILGRLTGERFGYAAHDPADRRATAVAAWRAWLAGPVRTAKLRLPPYDNMPMLGRTAIAITSGSLVEIDRNGKTLREIRDLGQNPWGVQVLANGHVLVGVFALHEIREYDATGTIVWSRNQLPGGPMSVERLENGNTLTALSDARQVVEFSPVGEIVWQVRTPRRPADARRLKDGRTLIAEHVLGDGRPLGRLFEVDRDGNEVWSIGPLRDPQRCQRLDNGNTLVVLSLGNAVVEYDRKGTIVWSRDGFDVPLDAHRLPDGNTVVVDRHGLHEISPEGEEVWHHAVAGASRAWRY